MSRISPDGRAMLLIAGVVILANLPYLLGIFDANPLGGNVPPVPHISS